MEISDKEHSVYQTVTKMCRHLARTYCHDSTNVECVTKHIRSLAFEIFIFKCKSLSSSTERHNGSLEEEPDMILADILFQACQDGKKNPVCVTKTKNVLNVIKKMSDVVQMHPELVKMLKFLLLMANSEKVDENELEPLYGLDLRKYDFLDDSCWKKSYKTQLFQLNNELLQKKDVRFKTITSFPFTEELGSGLQYKEYFVVPSNKEDVRNWSFKNLKDYGFDDSEWMPTAETKNSVVKAPNSDDGYVTPDRDISEDTVASKPGIQWSKICNVNISEFHTWEDLGGIYTQLELPFISECKESAIHLYNLVVNKRLVKSPQLSCISIDKFKQDVVRLLFGLESQTFFYNEERKTFVLQPGVYLDGISPDTLQDLCIDFITCANNYYVLSSFLQRDSDGLNLTRRSLVFEALCNCLLHYICCYRGVVLHMSRKLTLIEGCHWIQTLKNQLEFLRDFCCLNSSQEFSGLPHGGALLAYVYNHMCQVTKKDITCILYYILESCCNVYFRFLEKWIFEGICEDYYGEFFVEPKGMHELSQDRQYWSRGFVINKRLVPLFLSGLENDIFICGKYMRLLKLCKPNDPFFSCLQNGYPSILCCLDQQGLNRLVNECESFKKRCIDISGTSPDIISNALFEERRESYFTSLKQQRDRTLEKIKKGQEAKRKLQAENKRIMFETLKKDMEEARAHKIQEEKNRIKEEEKMLMEARRLDELNELRIQEERQKLIQYYSELSESIDLRKREADLEVKKLRILEAKLLEKGNDTVNIQIELESEELETTEEKTCTNYKTLDDLVARSNDPSITLISDNAINEEIKCSQKEEQDELTKLELEHLPEECVNIMCHEENKAEINEHDRICEYDSSKINESNTSQKKIISEDSFTPEIEITMSDKERKLITNISNSKMLNKESSQIENVTVSTEINVTEMKGKTEEMLVHDVRSEKSSVQSSGESNEKDSIIEKSSKEACCESVLHNLTDNKIIEQRNTKLLSKIEGVHDTTDINKIPWYNGGCMFKNNQFYFDKNPIIINITKRVLKVEMRKVISDIKQIPMATVNQAINKSVMIPLKIQLSLANDAILRLFINEHKLITHLDCLRKYFFLLDGEYGHNLKHSLFTGIEKVSKPSLFLTHFNLNSLLRCAVRNTSVEDFSERLSFLVKDVPTAFHLTDPKVLDCLSLRYRIQWPVNIIITPEAILKYDQVFNFVMQLHRASWVLEQEIHILKIKLKKPSIQYRQVQLYRHVMTQFVRTWLNYITATALEDSWIELKHNLQKADNIDRIYAMHVYYIKSVTFRCLLNKQSKIINSYLLELLHAVFKFNEVLRNGEWVEATEGGELQHTAFSHLSHEYGNFLRLSRYLYKYIQRLVSIGYQSRLDRLLVLLSGNDFYKVKS